MVKASLSTWMRRRTFSPNRRTIVPALMPYLIGIDLNSDPEQCPQRYIINFHDWPLRKSDRASAGWAADEFPELLRIVEESEAATASAKENNSTSKHRREHWLAIL